jgi:hypothetical protein
MYAATWRTTRKSIADPVGEIVMLASQVRALSVGDVIALWRDDAAFRDFFFAILAASPYEAFFWEMPPVDAGTLARDFECAVLRSGTLARMQADDTDFAEHLCMAEPVAAFPNLSGDALLIAPRKIAAAESYGHIAAFVRGAPRDQQHALLRSLALEIEKRLAASRERFWISTAGLGVPWVHVRLDKKPKYYQYKPYK